MYQAASFSNEIYETLDWPFISQSPGFIYLQRRPAKPQRSLKRGYIEMKTNVEPK